MIRIHATGTTEPAAFWRGVAACAGEAVRRARGYVPGELRPFGRRASWALGREFASAALARRYVRAQLGEWGWRGPIEVVELVVTELVGNALRHTAGRPVLTLVKHGDVVRCEVADDEPAFLRPSRPGRIGHGLVLVDLLSMSWGAVRIGLGKVVWCEVSSRAWAV
ncbi:hypothetical protein JOL79_17120 [Microbispora sp. RL4-1S]|uniref:ATP-binding protein n=1 Tax=Microbispora oryzae TaxID=2806554 RepID=A0A941AIS6_9ACTN|nr:hypothetical protein [Microbispora oryzae]MBP2705535.1 hypothetical protein [Microbispora oryzae]